MVQESYAHSTDACELVGAERVDPVSLFVCCLVLADGAALRLVAKGHLRHMGPLEFHPLVVKCGLVPPRPTLGCRQRRTSGGGDVRLTVLDGRGVIVGGARAGKRPCAIMADGAN